MRVLWICGLEPNKMGGFERLCGAWAHQSQADGIQADFVFESEPCEALATQLRACGCHWCVIPDVGRLGWKQDLALWRYLRHRRPDLAHLHFCRLFCLFFVLADLLTIPMIATYHYSGQPKPATGVRHWLKSLRQRLLSGSIRRMTAVSDAARDKLVADYLVPSHEISVTYNGTLLPDERSPANKASAGSPQATCHARAGPAIVFVGTLIPEKGAEVAIRAIAACENLPGARLTVVGEGPELGRLQQLAAMLGLEQRVEFLGRRNDVPDILARQDLLVAPSLWTEAFGYIVIEAMAAGCAPIASAVGGIAEIITHERDGLLVPPGDHAALSRAIRLLWQDAELRRGIVSQAHQTVKARFTLTQCLRRYRDLYGGVVPGLGRNENSQQSARAL